MYCGLYKSNKCSFYPQSFHLKYLNNYSLHSIRQANGVWRLLATQPRFWLHVFANTQGHGNVTVQFGLTTPNRRLRVILGVLRVDVVGKSLKSMDSTASRTGREGGECGRVFASMLQELETSVLEPCSRIRKKGESLSRVVRFDPCSRENWVP